MSFGDILGVLNQSNFQNGASDIRNSIGTNTLIENSQFFKVPGIFQASIDRLSYTGSDMFRVPAATTQTIGAFRGITEAQFFRLLKNQEINRFLISNAVGILVAFGY